MSSFNLIPGVKPVIREAASMSNDGGGGNLGYMQRGQDEKEKKNKYLSDESIFGEKDNSDIFIGEGEIEVPDEYKFNFKNVFKKLIQFLNQILK